MKRGLTLAGLLVLVVGNQAAGCFWFTSKSEGETLQSEVSDLKESILQLESEQQQKEAHLTEMISRARLEVDKLEQALTKATRILSRNSADFGTDMESMKEKLRKVDGILAEMRHDLQESQQSLAETNRKVQEFALAAGIDLPIDGSTVPKDANKHLDMIREAYAQERYSEARALSSLFLERYPRHASADVAQLHIARSYVAQKRWAKALGALRTFTDKYPESANTPEALYAMAQSFFALGDCTDARILIDALTTRHKNSDYADKARQLRDQIKKNKSRCTS
jgi:TolA-binding protein